MNTRFIEATSGPMGNWGKFIVSEFTPEEWEYESACEGGRLLDQIGWDQGSNHYLVHDMQTGEGAFFRVGGSATADLNGKHKIWVCPLFEPFLNWLYSQPLPLDLQALPARIDLESEVQLWGYRRSGGDPG